VTKQISLAEEELALAKAKMEGGLTSREELLSRYRALESLRGDAESYAAEEQKAVERKTEAESKIREYTAALSSSAKKELASVNERIAETESGLFRLETSSGRLEVLAPVSGLIHALAYKTAGTVLSAGALVTEIIPVGDNPKAQIRIDPKSIGSVHPGLAAKIKVSAYPSDRYGAFRGRLAEVSPTTFIGNDGKPYYRGIVEISGRELEDSGPLDLVPGMTLTAELRTGSKTLLDYLLKPIFASARESFREK
jgi:adhesin transport system membrane fusion protein